MKEEIVKITFKSFLFEIAFSTEYSASIRVIDALQEKVYENKNVEFHKIQKNSVITALQQKNKEITCQISEKLIEDRMNRSPDEMRVQEKGCLDITFIVKPQFIVPFSQKILLYETKSQKHSQKLLPKQLSSKTAKEIRKSIQLLQKSISVSGDNQNQNAIQVYQTNLNASDQDRVLQNLFFPWVPAALIALLILWIVYLEFLHVLLIIVISVLVVIYYLSTQKYLLSRVPVKEGYYKVTVTGMISTPTSYTNNHVCFRLYAGFNPWDRQKLKIYFQSNYSYAYPFCGTFLVEAKMEQELVVEIQKTKFNNVNVQNVVIVMERLSGIAGIK